MKMSLHFKTVQSLFIILLLCLTQATTISAQQAISEWRSAATGDFNNVGGNVWEKNVLGVWTLQAAAAKPSGSSNVTIRAGHTVTMSATTSILGLTIESGGKLNSTAAITAPITFRIGTSSSADITAGYTSNVVVIQNDGILGSLSDADAGINLEVEKNCKTLTIQGSGTCRIGRTRFLYPNGNVPATFNVNQSIYLGLAGSGSFTAYYNNAANTTTEDNIINIAAGKTVTLVAGGSFHGGVSSTTPTTNPQGKATYNIFGTLDLSATSSGGLQTSTGATASSSLNLTIKNGGLLKLGTSFAAYRGANIGSINMAIEDGGVVDGTLLTSGLTNNSSTLMTGYTWFVITGSGVFKQTVGASSVTYPVSTSSGSYNPVTLSNGGGNIFTVNVATGNSPAGLANASKAINRTWNITPATTPATADLNFGYNASDVNAGCTATDLMQLAHYTGSAWEVLGSATPTVPSSGATGLQVGYSGITSFSPFTFGNVGSIIPVELVTFKAYVKGSVNVLEWTTATERNNREFAIERSLNGVDFQQIGSVKGSGNSSVVKNYSFTDDAAPLSIGYYRLRQIDFDGREAVSKAVSVTRNGGGKIGISKIYPSVTSDYLNVEMTTIGNTTLTISDLLGRVVSTKQLGDTNGTLLQRLDVTSLSSGLYFVTLQSGSTGLTEKFEKN